MKKFLLFLFCLSLSLVLFSYVYSDEPEAGKVKLNGLMQFWYEKLNGGIPGDTFSLRRAEIELSGAINPKVTWKLMIDPARVMYDDIVGYTNNTIPAIGNKSILRDFVISFWLSPIHSIQFGQFTIPFGLEGTKSSKELDFVERSSIVSKFGWGEYRDIGFSIKANLEIGNVKIMPEGGLFNGEGENKLDGNDPMDFVGRVLIKPNDRLDLGIGYHNGLRGFNETEHTWGGFDIKYLMDPFTLYTEYARGVTDNKDKSAYYFAVVYKISDMYEAVCRYDTYDPDKSKKDDSRVEFTFGLNYFIDKHNAKMQLNYVSVIEERTTIDNDIVRFNIQIGY